MKIKNIIKSAVKAKVATAKAKAKAKVAAKLAAKTQKCKGGKCSPCDDDCDDGSCSPCSGGKCKPCAVALALFLAATMCGCQGLTSPSRSQTLTIKDCNVYIIGSGDGTTNDVARVEIASQAMSIENSGTESQTATPTQTTDVKPDIDVNYNGPTKSVADASQGVLESAVNVIKAATDKGDE